MNELLKKDAKWKDRHTKALAFWEDELKRCERLSKVFDDLAKSARIGYRVYVAIQDGENQYEVDIVRSASEKQ